MLVITLIILAFGLSACSSDSADNGQNGDDHGITLIPIVNSDGSTNMLFLPH